jgi:undecaprenyl-diphosphatase
MSGLQALITAILQGLTELFPVSSLGHAVILPRLLHWGFSENDPSFLPFLVVLHLGTAAALLAYFWRDWWEIVGAFFGAGSPKERRERWRLLWLIVVATIPAVIVGAALEKILRHLFGSPQIAAAFLIVNGVILLAAERLRRRAIRTAAGAAAAPSDPAIAMSWRTALMIGCWQCLALIPGISRSGATMVGGLLGGLRHQEAARFSFLIATPIILGAAVLEVPHFLHHHAAGGGFGPMVWVAGIVAGIAAYASTAFLMRYFGRHDFEALDPFAYYCVAAGAIALILIQWVV